MLKLLSIIFLFASCAQVTSLNLTKHQFGVQPRKIIWVQIAGFSREHVALLKYDYRKSSIQTSFEKFLCYGSTWEYNLYDIRPSYKSSFNSQVTGKSNIKNSCSDYEEKPIWDYLSEQGYKTALFQTQAAKTQVKTCSEENEFYKNLTRWKMDRKKADDTNYFHFEKDERYKDSTLYYDKSCLTGKCFNSVSKNVVATFERFTKNSSRYLYLIQDDSYLRALKSNNFVRAKKILKEIDQTLRYLQKYTSERKDTLLLVSGAKAYDIDFPKQGEQWEKYITKGEFIKAKESELVSDIMATGARSENFCGMYNQSEILNRIFSGAKQQGLKLEFINPFN